MCYHISRTSTAATLAQRFNAQPAAGVTLPVYHHVSAFVHPALPVVTGQHPGVVQLFSWGLLPEWVKSGEQAAEVATKTLNARGETIYEKPSFRRAAAHQRCLILIDGFFEWMHRGGRKYPFFIRTAAEGPFALGGLWSAWADPATGELFQTCSVVTTEANVLMARIHNTKQRMPLVLPPAHEHLWMQPDLPRAEVEKLMRPIDEAALTAHTVSPLVSRQARENSNVPAVSAPFAYPELAPDGAQKTPAAS